MAPLAVAGRPGTFARGLGVCAHCFAQLSSVPSLLRHGQRPVKAGRRGKHLAVSPAARVQKTIISACNILGKPIIITRVMDTMVRGARPWRVVGVSFGGWP